MPAANKSPGMAMTTRRRRMLHLPWDAPWSGPKPIRALSEVYAQEDAKRVISARWSVEFRTMLETATGRWLPRGYCPTPHPVALAQDRHVVQLVPRHDPPQR